MKRIYLLIAIFSIGVLFFVAAPQARASEGTAELQSTAGQPSRCFVSSTLMTDFSYSLLVSCRDLVYPPASDIFAYILWINSLKEGKPEKLGELGVGKAEFRTRSAFSSLFVTKERDGGAGSPSEAVVMHGAVKPISFLEGPPPPTTPEEIQKPLPAPTVATPAGELAAGIRRALITFFIVLLIFIIIVIAAVSTFRRLRG